MRNSAGSCSRNENGFQASVAVAVQPPRRDWFIAPHDSASSQLVFGACVSHNCQTAITPKLAFCPKSMWSASRSDDLSSADGTHLWNRSQQLDGLMPLPLSENSGLGSFPEFTNVIQLFIQPRGSLLHSLFG